MNCDICKSPFGKDLPNLIDAKGLKSETRLFLCDTFFTKVLRYLMKQVNK